MRGGERQRGGGKNVHHERAQAAVLLELQTVLRDDVTDPELEGVRVTAVVLSSDMRAAKVHFAVPRGRPRSAAMRAFDRASPFLRARLAEGVDLKRTPELRFVYESELDPTAEEDVGG